MIVINNADYYQEISPNTDFLDSENVFFRCQKTCKHLINGAR